MRGQEVERELGAADAPCRIEARTEEKAQGMRVGPALEPGGIGKRGKSRILASP